MVHRLLVPLDGSDQSESALPYAREMARCFRARVLLVRVVQPLFVPPVPTFAGPQISALDHPGDTEAAQAYLQGQVRRLAAEGIEAETVVRHGDPSDEILECIEEYAADLVVLVAEEHQGIARWTGEHMHEAVIARAGVPVLVVPPAPAQGSGRGEHGV